MTHIALVNTPADQCPGVFYAALMTGQQHTEIETVPDFYQKICNPDFYSSLAIVSLQAFTDIEDIDILDQISGLELTMRSQEPDWRLRLALVVDVTDDPVLVRRLQKLPEVVGLALSTDSMDTMQEALSYWTQAQRFTTHSVEKMLKRQRKNTESVPGQIVLTDRQQQILDMISTKGFSNKAIAKVLRITESTVKLHVSAILKKYCLKNRVQLAVYARGG
jgi:DNA-binding NarL/FixJ family response regulator